MNSTQVRVPPQNVSRVRTAILVAAAAVLALLAVRVFAEAIRVPDVVEEVTVVNETDYGVDVWVRGDNDDSWLRLGRAQPQGETERALVLDQGEAWIVRFDRGGVVGGEIELTRDALEAAGWRIEVPAEVAARLAEAGQAPSPTAPAEGP